MSQIKQASRVILLAGAVCVSAQSVHAQDVPSAANGEVSLGTRLSFDDNPDLGTSVNPYELLVEGTFALRFSAETRTQSLSLTSDGALGWDFADSAGRVFVTAPSLGLSYQREAADAEISFDVNARETDITSAFDIDPTSSTLLVADVGTLASASARAAIELGTSSPFSLGLEVAASTFDYEGTLNPDLFDNTRVSVATTAGFRLSGATQAELRLSFEDYDTDDADSTHTQTARAGISVTHELASALAIDGSLTAQRRDVITGTLTDQQGIIADLGVSQGLPDGRLFARAIANTAGVDDRTSLTFGRELSLASGEFEASLTATSVAGSGLIYSGTASFERELRDGALALSLDQSIETDASDDDFVLTRLNIDYTKSVTATSAINLTVDVTRSEETGTGAPDPISRGTIAAAYSQTLARDWDLSVGYRHRFTATGAATDAASNQIYLSVSKNIGFNF